MSAVKLAVSILAADFGRLAEQVQEAEAGGADWVHVDVMDGQFVPPITMGPAICGAVRRATELPLDVHLMIAAPEQQIAAFADAGATGLTVHWEACPHAHRALEAIRKAGLRAGVAVNPGTPVTLLADVLDLANLVLVMSVDPGWGGQPYLPNSTRKLQQAREMLAGRGGVELEVDGGIDPTTARAAVSAGATVLVAGSSVYKGNASVADSLAALRAAAAGA